MQEPEKSIAPSDKVAHLLVTTVGLESVSLASQPGRQEPDAKACVEKPRV